MRMVPHLKCWLLFTNHSTCVAWSLLRQAAVNEAACKQLERKLQDITAKLVADRQEHADKVRLGGVGEDARGCSCSWDLLSSLFAGLHQTRHWQKCERC
jgi:hypothetical protein